MKKPELPKLPALREKHSIIGNVHEPNPACKFCTGSGERPIKRGRWAGEMTPCICLFVDHDASDEIGTLLGNHAKAMLAKLDATPGEPEEGEAEAALGSVNARDEATEPGGE